MHVVLQVAPTLLLLATPQAPVQIEVGVSTYLGVLFVRGSITGNQSPTILGPMLGPLIFSETPR